jgi:DNA-binding response OmpR family regulator
LTAHANADARIEALRAGYDIYLTKPVDAAELSAVLNRLGRRPKPS